MDIIKIIGIALVSLVLIIIIKQYKPEFAIYISLLSGAIILILIFQEISKIIKLLGDLSSNISLNNMYLKLLIKITGIAFLIEFASSICKDSGEVALANKVDLAGKVIIMSMSIPIISGLLEVLLKILP